ncbi:MAG: tetratricopeptide repeat protein [Vicinamibacterales bacterium]
MVASAAVVAQAPAAAPPQVTFSKDVAPLLFDRCVKCHHPDGPAPFSLASYQEARRRAAQIANVTASRAMPPWKSEPGYGEFIGQTPLTDAEIDTIEKWVSDGALEGDPTGIRPPSWTPGWQLGTPDLVLNLAQPFTLRADGADVWRVFVFPVPVSALRFVKGLEFRPGNTKTVHHARIRIDRTPASRRLDDQDPAPGYDGLILRSAVYPDGHFLGWTPGQAGPLLPKGLAWRLEPGVDLVVETHMVPSGMVERVAPSIGLYFTTDPPERTPAILRLGRKNLDIPAGNAAYVSSDSFVLPVDAEIQAVQPHAHYRARSIISTATLPDGTIKPLIYIADWDVRWQHLYQYAAPMMMPKGTTIEMRFTFDNSVDNPRNPQLPPRRVFWGEEATSEMGELWIQLLTRTEADRRALNASIEPKMVAEDVIGYEARLRSDAASVSLHDDAGDGYLYLGQPDKAIAHFAATLALAPDSAPAHYNLGNALAEAGRAMEAADQFRMAIRIRPEYSLAHNNLGSVLARAGTVDEAMQHFREAMRTDPANADAHFNAASVLYSRGDVAQAAPLFRRAVQLRPEWPAAVSSLAWLLATSPAAGQRAPAEAIEMAERAVALTERSDAGVLDVLAAAYASGGQFARAEAVADEAIALKPEARVAAAISQRRALYARHQPYLTPARR